MYILSVPCFAQVTCLAICPELDLVLSGSADGAILMHTLGEGR